MGLVLVSLAALAAGVYALNDEALFVSPPEATAQRLLRAISRGRVGATRAALSRDAQRATSDREITRIAEAFQARVGRMQHVRSEPLRRRGDTLVVLTSVQGERADPELLLRMVREAGAWSVTHLEDVLPAGSTVPSTPR
jgi:hypothetical protein